MYSGTAKLTKSYRIISRSRFTVFLILLALLIFFMGGILFSPNSAATEPQNYITVEVKSGDTLWQIAGEHKNKGKDIRKLVYEINTINALAGSSIYPGQLLKIPVDSA